MDFFAINWANFLPCPEKTPGLYSILGEWGSAMSQINRDGHPQFVTHSLISDILTIHVRQTLSLSSSSSEAPEMSWKGWHTCVLLGVHLVKNATKNVHLQQFSPGSGVKAKSFQFSICEWKATAKNKKQSKQTKKPACYTEKEEY